MIEGNCACGTSFCISESAVNVHIRCGCGRALLPVSAEALADGTGAGDFDTMLIIESGPSRCGEVILLGGCLDIEIGELQGKHIHLPDEQVSRLHAKLVRVDFGPSRWRIDDNRSDNGLFINGSKVASHELQDGDLITIGNYDLRFTIAATTNSDAAALPPIATMANAAPVLTEAPPVARVAQALTYQTHSGESAMPGRPLTECDQSWVVRLRIASVLLLLGLVITFFIYVAHFMQGFGALSRRAAITEPAKVPLIAAMIAAVVGGVAAWLLTTPEPMGAGEYKHRISAILLRIAATIAAVGELISPWGVLLDVPAVQITGTLIALAGIPRVFLLLYYIRHLALRIPNEWLAANCIIVMIGLPATLGLIASGVIYAIWGGGAGGLALTSAGLGACGFIVFGLWYIILMIWFQSALDF